MIPGKIANVVFAVMLLVFVSGCGQFLGNLRRDLDDSEAYEPATVGGQWSERGYLFDDDNDAVGHAERGLASSGYYPPPGKDSWVSSGERAVSNRRDMYRGLASEGGPEGVPTFSNTPTLQPPVKRFYSNGKRATRADFVDAEPNEGSLWASDGQTNYYFTKNKVRGIGDVVTVNIEQGLATDVYVEVKRALNPREKEMELRLAQERAEVNTSETGNNKDSLKTTVAAPNRGQAKENEKEEVKSRKLMWSDVDLSKQINLKAGETLMAEIIERYPNGNYKIRGTKKILFRNNFRMLTVVAIARGSDISEDDIVNSGKLYEYRLEVVR